MSDVPYGKWRDYDPEDTVRFYALRLSEAGMIAASPQKIIADGTDFRIFEELKRELKGRRAARMEQSVRKGGSHADHPESPHFRGRRRGGRRCELFGNYDKGVGEPPPETTRIRLIRIPSICQAPSM